MRSLALPLRVAALSVSLVLLVSACTSDEGGTAEPEASIDPLAQAAEAADVVIPKLAEGDEEALASAGISAARRFLRARDEAVEAGLITEVVFSQAGEPAPFEGTRSTVSASSPSPTEGAVAVVAVPYEVSWTSEVGGEEIVLTGDLLMDRTTDGWAPRLNAGTLFPGEPGAKNWAVEMKWLRRGRILDRDGALLATGSIEKRRYPEGSTAGTTIGHIGALTKKDVKDGASGAPGELIGASGLEETFQERLGGTPERRLLLVDRKGEKIRISAREEGKPGRDLRTTLDLEIQRAAEGAYGSVTGGSVVIQPKTGDLLAVVSSSPFDPNNYVGAADVEPFNRALSGLYPPGSSMKVMTAAGALDSKTVSASTTVTGPAEYQGVRNFESGVFGSIPFSTAVKFSVNTAFAQVAEDMGAKKLTKYAEAFGFNGEPAIGFAGTSSFPLPEDLGDLMWASVGQAQTLATPMQMASVSATIANGGIRMEPRIAMHVKPRGERAVSAKVARTMTSLMESVVEGGTGVDAQIAGVRVAGKTGTAEVDVAGERKNHAWFVAFAPAGAPELAIAVVSEYGGVGGQVAAPLARSIMQRVLPLL